METTTTQPTFFNPDTFLSEIYRTLSLQGERNIRLKVDGYITSRKGTTYNEWRIKDGKLSLFYSEEKPKNNE